MSEKNKPIHIGYLQATLVFLTFIILLAFCYFAQFPLIIPILILYAGAHLFLSKRASSTRFIQLGLLLSLMVLTTHSMLHYTQIPPLYLPIASVAILTMLLFNDLQLAFLMALMTSAVMGLMVGPIRSLTEMEFMLIYFIGGLTGAYTVRDARTRGVLLAAGFYVGIMQVVCMALVHPHSEIMFTREFVFSYVRPLIVNGVVSAFVVMATLKIFETMFGVLTNFSLMELSDFNQPLLKRMVLEAPGTYHHSLVVSNLAESGADAIGANALLTRVGAYYHDIGKLVKAEYFTENQLMGGNVHDKIEPSMSRLVILNHVKEGIELGKKYKLNRLILDFIPQHHGTSLMYYFYQKALEETEDESTVKEENYRYPGPKPQSREAAIVLLADSVEGSTRALDEATPKKIEEQVHKIINNKFIDGQLDECNLTLKEIDIIAKTFIRVLSAMYHGRVRYPEKKNVIDDRNQKSAEEFAAPDSPPQKDHPKGP